jgi:tetratricopeptide (TPR) repeat protein
LNEQGSLAVWIWNAGGKSELSFAELPAVKLAPDFLIDLESDRFEAAFSGLHNITRQYPSEAGTAYLEFGRALNQRAKYQEALPILRTAVEKNPDSSMAHY